MNANLGKLMQQAQKLQEEMKKKQEELQLAEFEGQSGAGMVSVIMTGKYDVKRVKIDPSLLNEEPEMLEDLLAAAVNDAVRKVESVSKQNMSGMMQGFDLPPGFKFPF
ncbi:MAG: YbaB/EbfC family nucleoid-associated protein [Francisellaceae bacterium]